MKKKIVIAASLAAVTVIGATCAAAAYLPAENTQKNILTDKPQKINHPVEQTAAVTPEKFTEAVLDMDYAEEMFEYDGFKKSDRRVISDMQTAKAVRSVGSEKAKEYIYDRMLNTMDFYKTLKGSYVHNEYSENTSYTVDYATINGSEPLSYEKVQYKGKNKFTERVYKNGVVRQAEVPGAAAKAGKAEFTGMENLPASDRENDTAAIIKSTSRKKIDEEGIPNWYYRMEFNGLATARECISPQEIAFGFLSDFSTWSIEEQTTFLNRSCYVISGNLGGSYSDKLQTAEFKMWVDVKTGVLLKSRWWNKDGSLTDAVTATSFEADENIAQTAFITSWSEKM